ncbi:MAG: PP2C family protein-serine/threonine phosphatase [Candidatus Binataceae bacterium]
MEPVPERDRQIDPPEGTLEERAFDIAVLSDIGMERDSNEDSCGYLIEGSDTVVFAVADGIGGYEGGEVASAMAVEKTFEAWRDSPASWGAGKRLARAVQRANIEIHNRALTVPELRMMGTTLTAVAIESGMLYAAHVGDCRLYLFRGHKVVQLSKDHSVTGERVRMGMMSEDQARVHPERSMLTRTVGHDLIASVDRISMPLVRGDRLVLCSDGLYNVLREAEIEYVTRDQDAASSCRNLIDAANERRTGDNLTAAVFRMTADTGLKATPIGWRAKLLGLFRR